MFRDHLASALTGHATLVLTVDIDNELSTQGTYYTYALHLAH